MKKQDRSLDMKRFNRIILILSAMILVCAFAMGASASSDSAYVLGDANGSGSVDIRDASTVQKVSVHILELSGTKKLAADVNLDGRVNIRDATLIQKYLLNNSQGQIGQQFTVPTSKNYDLPFVPA